MIFYKGRHKYAYFVVSFVHVEALCFAVNYKRDSFPFNVRSREGVLDASAAEGFPLSQDLIVEP